MTFKLFSFGKSEEASASSADSKARTKKVSSSSLFLVDASLLHTRNSERNLMLQSMENVQVYLFLEEARKIKTHTIQVHKNWKGI